MRLLVIGGSGRVARLVRPALSAVHSLRILDLGSPEDPAVEYLPGSVTDPDALRAAAEGMEGLIYMAMGPYRNGFDAITSFDVNVRGVYLALRAARDAGIPHAVYTSSMSVYRCPWPACFSDEEMPPDATELYGLTKRLGEEACRAAVREWGMSVNALRLCLPRSEEQWLAHARVGAPTIETTGGDVARALLAALEYRNGFQAFMISGDYEQKTMSLEKAKRLLGWEPLARPAR